MFGSSALIDHRRRRMRPAAPAEEEEEEEGVSSLATALRGASLSSPPGSRGGAPSRPSLCRRREPRAGAGDPSDTDTTSDSSDTSVMSSDEEDGVSVSDSDSASDLGGEGGVPVSDVDGMWEYADGLFACGMEAKDPKEGKTALELLCQLYDQVEETLIGEDEEEEDEEDDEEEEAEEDEADSFSDATTITISSSSSSVDVREHLLLRISSQISALMKHVPLSKEEKAHFALWTHGSTTPFHLLDQRTGSPAKRERRTAGRRGGSDSSSLSDWSLDSDEEDDADSIS